MHQNLCHSQLPDEAQSAVWTGRGGVGAILGEEPNRCVKFCVCPNCNELEINNGSDQDYLKKIKKSFLENMTCTICSTDIYIDAVIINCGHTFCKYCIKKWQRTSPKTPTEPNAKCPLCNMVITTLTPNMSARNHINELCEVFLDGIGIKEREKSIQEHSENIAQLLPIEIKFSDHIITDDEDIEEHIIEDLEPYFEYYGFLTERYAGVGDIPPMPDDGEPGMVCRECRQETHCRVDLCINCVRLYFDFDDSTEPDLTTSNAPDPAATSAPADMEQLGAGVGAILEEPNITVDQVINENTRPEQDQSENQGYPSDLPRPQFTMNLPGPSDFTVARIINERAPTRDANNDITEDGIITNAEDIEQTNLETYSENLDQTYGAIPTDDSITDGNIAEGKFCMICVGCRQETHCIKYSRLFSDGLSEPDSTTSNAPDLAVTSAPADVEQPGAGVGAIIGEEPNRCVNFCVCSNCNELEIDNESEIESELEINNDSVIESENECNIENESITVDQVNNENTRPEQERSENRGYPSDFQSLQFTMNWSGPSAHILNGRAPTREMLPSLDEPFFYGYGHILNGNVPTDERPPPLNGSTFRIDYILNRHAPTGERPRPSPYTLEDRPRKSSNRRHLGR